MAANYWDEVAKFYTDAEGKQIFSKDELTAAFSLDDHDVTKFLAMFEYQRFDPIEVVRAMYKNFKRASGTEIKVTDGTGTTNSSVPANILSMISMVVKICVHKGYTVFNTKKRSLDMMVSMLGINTKIRKSGELSYNTITLPRILACFPMFTVEAYHSAVKTIVHPEQLGFATTSNTGKYFKTNYVASTINKALLEANKGLEYIIMRLYILSDRKLNSEKNNTIHDIEVYACAAVQCSSSTTIARTKFWARIKYDKKSIGTAAEHCKKALESEPDQSAINSFRDALISAYDIVG